MNTVEEDLARAAAAGSASMEGPKPLPPELLPVDAFPLEALPEAFRPWATDVAQRMQCPPDFVAVPMLVAAASLVARHVGIRPQVRTDWTERGNLWALIVGRPGQMKSPALAQALAPVERLEAEAAVEFNTAREAFQVDALAAKVRAEVNLKAARKLLEKNAATDVSSLLQSEISENGPVRRRYVVNDLTYEKLGEILAANPGGVLAVRDEVRGMLVQLSREESAPARAFFLQAWSGGRLTFDRIGRGTVTIEDARLSIIGCIQPGPLSELIQKARRGAADDGMLERFLIAWPDVGGDWREVDRWPETEARERVWNVFKTLDGLAAEDLGAEVETGFDGELRGLPYLRFAGDAREAFGEWRADFETTIRAAESEGLEAALSKFRHHVPALALALHVIDGGRGPVGLAPTLRALALAEYFESHARRLHGSGHRATLRAAKAILAKARAGALPEAFTARDIYRNQWAGLGDRATVADGLDALASHGWLTETTMGAGADGGRPTVIYGLSEGARHG